jgi:hypothetical protein
MDLPEPLTPSDLDLRDFGWMPLEVKRLRDSDLSVLAPGDAFRAAVLLWCAAWHQVPAGSVPNNDRLLANLAGYGRDLEGWVHVKADAMRGFVECSDGRLYHPLVCEKAIEADEQRKKQRKRTEAASSARRNDNRNDDRNDQRNDQRNDGRGEDRNGSRNEVQQTLPDSTLPKEDSRAAAKAQPCDSDAFKRFKKVFPRRDGANPWKPAEKKFNALVKTGVDPELMIRAAGELAREEGARGNVGTKFIPQAITWLNQQRFHDCAVASFDEPQETDWDAICVSFKRTKVWSKHAPGNDPNSGSCQCPPEILAKHGLLIAPTAEAAEIPKLRAMA